MDPVTAVGLVSSILTFIDFGTQLVQGAIEIRDSIDGSTEENRSSLAIASEMKRLAERLIHPNNPGQSDQEIHLCLLASECRALSTQLVELLERLKPKDAKSKRLVLKASLQSVMTKEERRHLEQRLNHCCGQLGVHMNYLTHLSVDKLVESARNDVERFEKLQTAIAGLHRGVHISSLGPEVQNQLRQLLNAPEVREIDPSEPILRALKFNEMNDRYEKINEAHFQTFLWIFDHDNEFHGSHDLRDHSIRDHESPEYSVRVGARTALLNWLASGTGVFHISGKPGSGKSTLMKYLSDNTGTRDELARWAGHRKLVLIKFFFWKLGTERQKSLAGLHRSLLHDILEVHRDAISKVLPDYVKRVKAAPLQSQLSLTILDSDIRGAFPRLLQTMPYLTNHCFCFFIDGLDEYAETSQFDSWDIARELQKWAMHSPSNLKLCVSSREDNPFMETFCFSQRLQLHQLTKFDLSVYARERLSHMRDQGQMTNIVDTIIDRAKGVFLWVVLVVKQLREELGNGAWSADLEAVLDELPCDLNPLYEHILETRLSKSNRTRAYKTLAMLQISKKYNTTPNLFAYSFLGNFHENPKFAQDDEFVTTATEEVTNTERVELGRKRLNGWCRGLVEASQDGDIDYIHRSLGEFLETSRAKSDMKLYTNSFEAINALSQLALAEMRLTGGKIEMLGNLIRMRYENGIDHAPFDYLDCLDSLDQDFWKDIKGEEYNFEFVLHGKGQSWDQAVGKLSRYAKALPSRGGHQATTSPCHIHHRCQQYDWSKPEYILWEMAGYSKLSPSKPSPSKLSPSKPSPSKLSPSKPSPSKLSPSKPSPSKLSPSKPSPSKLSPSKPSSSDPSLRSHNRQCYNALHHCMIFSEHPYPLWKIVNDSHATDSVEKVLILAYLGLGYYGDEDKEQRSYTVLNLLVERGLLNYTALDIIRKSRESATIVSEFPISVSGGRVCATEFLDPWLSFNLLNKDKKVSPKVLAEWIGNDDNFLLEMELKTNPIWRQVLPDQLVEINGKQVRFGDRWLPEEPSLTALGTCRSTHIEMGRTKATEGWITYTELVITTTSQEKESISSFAIRLDEKPRQTDPNGWNLFDYFSAFAIVVLLFTIFMGDVWSRMVV